MSVSKDPASGRRADNENQAEEEAGPIAPRYPVLASFAEAASRDDVEHVFDDVRSGLAELKGPGAVHKEKVERALALTQELLSHLLQVRETLAESVRASSKSRK